MEFVFSFFLSLSSYHSKKKLDARRRRRWGERDDVAPAPARWAARGESDAGHHYFHHGRPRRELLLLAFFLDTFKTIAINAHFLYASIERIASIKKEESSSQLPWPYKDHLDNKSASNRFIHSRSRDRPIAIVPENWKSSPNSPSFFANFHLKITKPFLSPILLTGFLDRCLLWCQTIFHVMPRNRNWCQTILNNVKET